MIKYLIPKEILKEGLDYNNAALSKIGKTPNYTSLHIINRFATGFYGEWGFRQYLDENKIVYTYTPSEPGKLDRGDYIIDGKKYNVKTANGKYQECLISVDAFNRHYDDFYVPVNIYKGVAIVASGCIERLEVAKIRPAYHPREILNYVVPYNILKPFPFLNV